MSHCGDVFASCATGDGQLVSCTLNVMRPDVANFLETLPSERYLAVMMEGAVQHGLPDSWIVALLKKDKTQEHK